MCSSDSFAQENLKTLLNKRLNDNIFSTFEETFSNTNLDSVSELLPKVHLYNKERAKFVHKINIKYSVLLDYTVLDISEVLHWAETFQVLVKCTFYKKPNQHRHQLKLFMYATTGKCKFKSPTGWNWQVNAGHTAMVSRRSMPVHPRTSKLQPR